MAFSFRVAYQTSGRRRLVGAPGAPRSLLPIESRCPLAYFASAHAPALALSFPADAPLAASSIRRATACGCDTYTAWPRPCEANFLSRGGLHLRRSLFNKICDSSWLRYVDGVTPLDLNDRSTRALGHGTLGIRWNHLVLGGDQVPARLGPPRGFADRAANGAHAPRNLGVSHKRGFFWVHVGCERGWKLRLVEEQKAVLRGQYRRCGRAGRRIFNKRPHRLALVWSKGSDVYEGGNLWMVPGFRDYRSPVGMANENCRSVLRCKNSFGNRDIVLQRYRRVLDDAHLVAVPLQDLVDALHARAVDKATMD